MNKDQIKGAAKTMVGKIQEAAGRVAGSKECQASGLASKFWAKPRRNTEMQRKP